MTWEAGDGQWEAGDDVAGARRAVRGGRQRGRRETTWLARGGQWEARDDVAGARRAVGGARRRGRWGTAGRCSTPHLGVIYVMGGCQCVAELAGHGLLTWALPSLFPGVGWRLGGLPVVTWLVSCTLWVWAGASGRFSCLRGGLGWAVCLGGLAGGDVANVTSVG